MDQAIALRRTFRRALEANDPALIKEALAELRTYFMSQPEPIPALVTLVKLLVEKTVTSKDLPLLEELLSLKLRPEWLVSACQKSGKDGWAEGYLKLRMHTHRPPAISLTEAYILGENNGTVRADTVPIKNLKGEIENLIAYARKTPGTMSGVCQFLDRLGYKDYSVEALDR